MIQNKELKKQFKRIVNIVNSDLSIKSQIELCKDSWNEYDNNNIFISSAEESLYDIRKK